MKERAKRFFKYMEVKRLNDNQVTVSCDLSQGLLGQARTGKSDLGSKTIDKILKTYQDLNKVWLLTGEGEMLVQSKPVIVIPGVKRASELEESVRKDIIVPPISGMLPESTFKFAAGQTRLVNETEKVNRYWFLPDCTDCEAVAPVAGTSMLPNLPPGCFVALKRYNITADNPNTIPFGQIFGIVVEDEHTGEYHGHIKVLRRHKEPELAAKYWIAHSFNTAEFDDFDIALTQVRSLWIVKQHIVSDTIY